MTVIMGLCCRRRCRCRTRIDDDVRCEACAEAGCHTCREDKCKVPPPAEQPIRQETGGDWSIESHLGAHEDTTKLVPERLIASQPIAKLAEQVVQQTDDDTKPLSYRIYGLCNALPKVWLERGCDLAEEVQDLEDKLSDAERRHLGAEQAAGTANEALKHYKAMLAQAERERDEWQKFIASERARWEAMLKRAHDAAENRVANAIREERDRCLAWVRHFNPMSTAVDHAIKNGAPAPKCDQNQK